MNGIKITKEELIEALDYCRINNPCRGEKRECPLLKYSIKDMGGVSCTDFLKLQAKEYIMSNNTPDIPKIIDEAMEKKNRSVTVFVGPQGTTVNVYPYQETKPHWIRRPAHRTFECSECGISEQYESPYCPGCGEKLAISDTFYECNKCRNSDNGLCDECMRCKDNSNFKPIEKPEVTEDEPETPVE